MQHAQKSPRCSSSVAIAVSRAADFMLPAAFVRQGRAVAMLGFLGLVVSAGAAITLTGVPSATIHRNTSPKININVDSIAGLTEGGNTCYITAIQVNEVAAGAYYWANIWDYPYSAYAEMADSATISYNRDWNDPRTMDSPGTHTYEIIVYYRGYDYWEDRVISGGPLRR